LNPLTLENKNKIPRPQRTLPSIDIYEEKNILSWDAWKIIRVSLGGKKKEGGHLV